MCAAAIAFARVRLLYFAAPDPKGTVIDQSPKAGAFTGQHKVTLITSDGPPNVDVPNVINAPWDDAKKALDTAGLLYTVGPPQSSETIAAGRVLSVRPDRGTSVAPDPPALTPAPYDSAVVVHVSKGPDLVEVPDVTFETLRNARLDLRDAGLVVGTVTNDSGEDAVVMSKDPAGGKLARGSSVDLVLRKSNRG